MSNGSLSSVLPVLQRMAPSVEETLCDEELLSRFVTARDENAFLALLQRHGPMVYGVCMRALSRSQDAEDAFQATFLLLATKAATLAQPERLGNWLYGVASRMALKARALRRDIPPIQPEQDFPEDNDPAQAASFRESAQVLDEEMAKLPDRYREPLVLFYFQGWTQEEIAQALDCPRKTITTRLTRARDRLRGRLERRGITLTASILVTVLSHSSLSAVPSRLMATSLTAATKGMASPPVITLVKGAHRAMFLSKCKWLVFAIAGLILAGMGALQLTSVSATEPGRQPVFKPVPEAKAPQAKITVANQPPVVVKTVPQAGSTDVDATSTKEIRVTFSKEMKNGNWSVVQISKDTFPKVTGKPSYTKDGRTCIIPVKLEPGKTWVLWLNSQKFQNFQDKSGRPAIPYMLTFETKTK